MTSLPNREVIQWLKKARRGLGATVVIGLLYSMFFGFLAGDAALPSNMYTIGYACLIAVALIHTGERYNRHVVDRELFWKFR